MNTEITESIKGWVFYDADCPFCRAWVGRTHGLLARRGLHFVPLQSDWVKARLGLEDNVSFDEMKLLTAGGKIYGGADALVRLARSIWWAWPVFAFAQIPGVPRILRLIYRHVARNRHCLGGRCGLPVGDANRRPSRSITTAFFELP